MDRRQALTLSATLVGGTFIGAEAFLQGCASTPQTPRALISNQQVLLLDEIAETILPETQESPGAKVAKVGAFMKSIITDCYSQDEQRRFLTGLDELQDYSQTQYEEHFSELKPENREAVLLFFDRKARSSEGHFYNMIKQLTLWGYFSSEVAARSTLRYNPIPGRFDGCVDYSGEAAWF